MQSDFKRAPISDEELKQWAELRADDAGHLARELIHYRVFPSPISADAVAAYTVDLTGCEHMSRDVALIERIAAEGSNGSTQVVYLYATPPAPVDADAVVEACAKVADEATAGRERLRLAAFAGKDKRAAHDFETMKFQAIELAHAIRALKGTFPADDGWRTMDSAPKDGAPVDLWCINHFHHAKAGTRVVDVAWGPVRDWMGNERDDWQHGHGEDFEPTHWRPRPAAPSTLVDQEGGV